MAKKNSKSKSFSLWKVFIGILIADAIFGTYLGLDLLVTAIMALPFITLVGAFMLVMNIINKTGTKKSTKTKNTVTVDEFLSVVQEQMVNGNRINLDNETFLLILDKENISLNNIDIFMRNEYIGNLAEYNTAFPNAFNTLISSITSNLKKNINKKAKKKEVVNEIIEQVEEIRPIEKDCSYYIDKLNQLNKEIENEEVDKMIEETVNYLKEIKQIEDEFTESKEKTKKLYQYYLPMYADILANYDRLADNAPASEEFKTNEAKLLKTSAMINSALSSLSSSLVSSYYTDLNVDMKTLESILKKDGLVEDMPFKKEG